MQHVLETMQSCQITAGQLVLSLLTDRAQENHSVNNLVPRAIDIFSVFLQHPSMQDKLKDFVLTRAGSTYREEILSFATQTGGWHFGASSATTKQLEDFSLEDMERGMLAGAPTFWGMLGTLLGDDQTTPSGHGEGLEGAEDKADEEVSYWDEVDEIDLEGIINRFTKESGGSSAVERQMKHSAAINIMKKIMICSILMQSMNRKSNTLQSILGIFLQSIHAPQKVIDTLARLGISISTDSINRTICSLSAESQNSLRELGQSLLASYTYDNFDVDLKSQVPQAEKSSDSLKHLTSGLLFPLSHDIALEDLKCSEELWRRSALNPHALKSNLPGHRTWRDLINIHPEPVNNSRHSWHDQFNAWLFLNNLCVHGPEYFHQFKTSIPLPCPIEQIPLTKTPIFAARAMDINNSTLRPKETGIVGSKPGFRHMHQLIGHAGTCRRLDCWRVSAKSKDPRIVDLETFTKSEPSLEDLRAMAHEMVHTYVATHRLQRMRAKQERMRNVQFENALLLNKYFLLYEELPYAMNRGDIGRVETCIVSWIPILKAVGKHKYATHMTNFLLNVHFLYPPGLKRAIQYHILVNPMGKAMKWRAVDWCVELNNLFTKVKNGGKGSNRTVQQILLKSPLVQVYRNIQGMVQQTFEHTHLTTNHADLDMTKTFSKMLEQFALNSPHVMMEKMAWGGGEEGSENKGDDRAELEDIILELM
ncbi:hypothetical protein PAXINDRAFT_11806 [Paxillus involutus ATCC 200175]|uniref:DUF6589 domain-containing protein n=1 Tax=Paxillus involutus ATCC 200175 TaxID=664439 RepID=A0A0C9U864_PAXIN|nr:hypothetical protein PAXINDRAFT_11806 [Paxillus involutus ATCC 200175]